MDDEQNLSSDIINENGDLFGTHNEDPNVFPTDTNIPLTDIGHSIKDYRTIFQETHQSNSQWRNTEARSAYNVSATNDGARQIIWKQAKDEINFVRGKVKAALDSCEPTIDNLVDLIFGPKSNIGRLLQDKLDISSEELLKQLGTFSLAAAYNSSKTQIFSKHSFVKIEGLADEITYQNFCNLIRNCGIKKKDDPAHVCGLKPLWMDVQSALNDTLRELFIQGFDCYMRVTEDDDKMHYEIDNKADTQGLKITQHVRDNRKGFVAHTTCFTASGLPIGIEWERCNDTATTDKKNYYKSAVPIKWTK